MRYFYDWTDCTVDRIRLVRIRLRLVVMRRQCSGNAAAKVIINAEDARAKRFPRITGTAGLRYSLARSRNTSWRLTMLVRWPLWRHGVRLVKEETSRCAVSLSSGCRHIFHSKQSPNQQPSLLLGIQISALTDLYHYSDIFALRLLFSSSMVSYFRPSIGRVLRCSQDV